MAGQLFVGLMSGTSVDGIDAALVSISADGSRVNLVHALGTHIPPGIRENILALCTPGDNEIDRLGELDVVLGRLFADTAQRLADAAGVPAADIVAIGSHGQTIRHRPGASAPFTLQLGDPNTIAELTGITTVADFRRRDMVVGGQGAPLVPAFHDAVFRDAAEDRLVVNIGGMANVTVLAADPAVAVRGFDTGPGNVLLDAWHHRHRGDRLDRGGAWAAGGIVDHRLLDALLAARYFSEAPPKSTGREYFSVEWLDDVLANLPVGIAPQDVQATLAELTARSIAAAITNWGLPSGTLYVCGGGVHNHDLCARLARAMPAHRVDSTATLGVDPDWVEAIAFAWLAQRTLNGITGNLPAVTGARKAVILGGIYAGTR